MAKTSNRREKENSPEDRNAHIEHGSARSKVGPLTEDGVEANDLPNQGRGSVESDPAKVDARKPTSRTGEVHYDKTKHDPVAEGDAGLRAHPDAADADESGGRGKN
ncbi:MAG: hypothetical protein ACFCVE_11290 [Phycisphaerae bacterium]